MRKPLFKELVFFFFPPHCVGCGKINLEFCKNCGEKLLPHFQENENKISIFQYENEVVKNSIKQAKYHRNTYGLKILSHIACDFLFDFLQEEILFEGKTEIVLIPIPIHKRKKLERGYNQSKKIAKIFSKRLEIPILENLVKVKNTKAQSHIKNREERLKNVAGSFATKNPTEIRGKICIVIDDVTTTGATLAEARKLLNKAGAKEVISFCLAH
jgi:competence protein ComFC